MRLLLLLLLLLKIDVLGITQDRRSTARIIEGTKRIAGWLSYYYYYYYYYYR